MKKNYFPLILFFSILSLMFILASCSDDENIFNDPPADTTAVNFNNIVLSERIPPFESSLSSADLYRGLVVYDTSSIKDVVLVDMISGSETVFYLRSGHMSDILLPGYLTKFRRIFGYEQITQAQFDTMKTMPDTDSILTGEEFTSDETETFTVNNIPSKVWGFYLQGKYDASVTPYKVFGLIYLESLTGSPAKLKMDVKINKLGQNRFAVTTNLPSD